MRLECVSLSHRRAELFTVGACDWFIAWYYLFRVYRDSNVHEQRTPERDGSADDGSTAPVASGATAATGGTGEAETVRRASGGLRGLHRLSPPPFGSQLHTGSRPFRSSSTGCTYSSKILYNYKFIMNV